jgi:hypothetical protein
MIRSINPANSESHKNSTVHRNHADGTFGTVLQSAVRSGSKSMDQIFKEASERYSVPENLLKAVAQAESDFNPRAVSSCGASGVMQLMPETAKSLGVTDVFDAEQNINGGAKYLSGLLKKYGGNVDLALAAYNAGPGNVAKYGGVPPFRETQNYISRIKSSLGSGVSCDADACSGAAASAHGGTSAASASSEEDVNAYLAYIRLNMLSRLCENLGSGEE